MDPDGSSVDVHAVLLARTLSPFEKFAIAARDREQEEHIGHLHHAADDMTLPSRSFSIGHNSSTWPVQANGSARSRRRTPRPASRGSAGARRPAFFTSTSRRPAFSFTKASSTSQFSSFFRSPARSEGLCRQVADLLRGLVELACEEAAARVCTPSRATRRRSPCRSRAPRVARRLPGKLAHLVVLRFLCRRSCRVHRRRDQRGMHMSVFTSRSATHRVLRERSAIPTSTASPASPGI